ncbi:MAG: hypothetical protein QNJ94_13735 [Alphaproteobacteria bacterium]|nr:hypothetical protein [Alphaproteobacteria bacterium]
MFGAIRRFVGGLGLVALLLPGCAHVLPENWLPEWGMPDTREQSRSRGQRSRVIQFQDVVLDLEDGRQLGERQEGILCVPRGALRWGEGRIGWTGVQLAPALRTELQKAKYVVAGGPKVSVQDPSTWEAAYLLTGEITELKADICYPLAGYKDFGNAKADVAVRVDWKLYRRRDRKVIRELSTEGRFEQAEAGEGGGVPAYEAAFAEATRALVADQRFYRLFGAGKPAVARPTRRPPGS